jgi:transposase
VQERARHVNRVHKLLETANIKLGAVASDVLGKSGRAILDAIVKGEQDQEALAQLACGRLRKKLPELRLALDGRVQSSHRFLLKRLLSHIDFLDRSVESVQQEIDEHMKQWHRGYDPDPKSASAVAQRSCRRDCRDRSGYDAFPIRRASGFMGRALPGQL